MNKLNIERYSLVSVSYTHLDVYKRQILSLFIPLVYTGCGRKTSQKFAESFHQRWWSSGFMRDCASTCTSSSLCLTFSVAVKAWFNTHLVFIIKLLIENNELWLPCSFLKTFDINQHDTVPDWKIILLWVQNFWSKGPVLKLSLIHI